MPREYKSVGYKKRHYEEIADDIRQSTDKTELVRRLEERFAGDNPRFDRSRFRNAAGY
jgi:hypothetical protein